MTKRKSLLLVVLSTLLLACLCVGISFGVAKPVNAAVTEIVLTDGAEVRLKDAANPDDISGIRFTATVSSAALANGDAGILVMRKADLESGQLPEVGNENAMDIKALHFYQESATDKTFSAVVYDIPGDDYATMLVARAYVMNGATPIYSDVTVERSIGQVASGLLAKVTDATQVAGLKAYVDAALISLDVDKTEVSLELSETETVTPTVVPANFTTVWASSNESVATVENGVITAVGYGTATVKAIVGSTEKEIAVTVSVPQAVTDELIGAYAYKAPAVEGFELTYTTDTAKIASDSTVGINVKANHAKDNNRYDFYLKTNKTVEAGRTYALEYTAVMNNAAGLNAHYIIFGTNQEDYATVYTAENKKYGSNLPLRGGFTFTATESGEFELILAFSPVTFTNFEYTICNLNLTDVTDFDARMYWVNGLGSGTFAGSYTTDADKLPDGVTTGIEFNLNYTAQVQKAYVKIPATIEAGKTYKINFTVKVNDTAGITNSQWMINFSDNISNKTQVACNDLRTNSDSNGQTYFECTKYEFTATADVSEIQLVLVMAPNTYSNYNFTISNISVTEVVAAE